jgi:hypothetical protein
MSDHRFHLLPEWLVSCRADWLRPNIGAGVTTGAVIIPKAMAYAMMGRAAGSGRPLYRPGTDGIYSVREINDPKHDRELTQRIDRAAWPLRRDFELRVA